MNFITNRIVNPVGDGPTFNDFIENLIKSAENNKPEQTEVVTAAGEAKPECKDDGRCQDRGQVISDKGEAGEGHQSGESVKGKSDQGGNARPDKGGKTDQDKNEQTDKGGSTNVKTKEAACGKEMGESGAAGKVTEDHTDAGPGNDENPDPKILINNDPCYQKGESTDGGKSKSKGKSEGKSEGKDKKSSVTLKFQKIATMNRLAKLTLFASLTSNKEYPIQYAEAMSGLKVANLTDEEKSWFTDFWLTMYPQEYVDEMVADR